MTIDTAVTRFSDLDERFGAALNNIVNDWAPEKPPVTLIMAEFGKVFVEAAKSNELGVLMLGLELVEDCMKDDQSVRDAVATGLLECLLAESSAQRLDFALIAQHLGAKSKTFCREWDTFTGVKTPGL